MGAMSLPSIFESLGPAELLQVESRYCSGLLAGRWLVALSWRRSVRPGVATFLKVVPGFERPRWRPAPRASLGAASVRALCRCAGVLAAGSVVGFSSMSRLLRL